MRTCTTLSRFRRSSAGLTILDLSSRFDNISTCRWCNINRIKLANIKCFTYVFPCDFAKTNKEVEIYGTGGMILQNMKALLHCLPGLERLELVDLQLDGGDGRDQRECSVHCTMY